MQSVFYGQELGVCIPWIRSCSLYSMDTNMESVFHGQECSQYSMDRYLESVFHVQELGVCIPWTGTWSLYSVDRDLLFVE